MRAVRVGLASLLTVFAFVLFLIHHWPTTGGAREASGGFEGDIRNETLGFEKVFVLNLPERGDRLDAFVLSSSLTGFGAEVMPGVNGSLVPDKVLPAPYKNSDDITFRNAQVGTWRAHLNIARRIVRDRLSSALIMEDDSDWDVTLKDRLIDFAAGARYLSQSGFTTKPPQTTNSYHSDSQNRSPYGDDWDLLWPGHCAIQIHADQSPGGAPNSSAARARFLIENDPTVPPVKRRINIDWIPDMTNVPESTRVVFKADMGICLYAYALSYRGAQKVLRAQAARKAWNPIDIDIGEMCQDREDVFNCVGVFPQLVDSHRTAGSQLADSNINPNLEDKIRDKGYTFNVIHSNRLNVAALLRGEPAVRQWPEDEPSLPAAGGKLKGPPTYRVVDRDEAMARNRWPENAPKRTDGKMEPYDEPQNDSQGGV